MLIAQKWGELVHSRGFGKEKRVTEGFPHGGSLSSMKMVIGFQSQRRLKLTEDVSDMRTI